jgi:hypothetical protein
MDEENDHPSLHSVTTGGERERERERERIILAVPSVCFAELHFQTNYKYASF